MVNHKVVLSRKVVLSWQALFRVTQVVSLRTSGGCGRGRNLATVTLVERTLNRNLKHAYFYIELWNFLSRSKFLVLSFIGEDAIAELDS